MMKSPRYRTLLRTTFSAIMNCDLSVAELRTLADELRRGQLTDELAYMIEKMSGHFQEPSTSRLGGNRTKNAEEIIRERKISKAALFNILQSLDPLADIKRDSTTRAMLQQFFDSAPDDLSAQLLDILSASAPLDPYLKGISETRR